MNRILWMITISISYDAGQLFYAALFSYLPFLFHHLKKYYNAKNWLMKKEYYHNALKMLRLQLQEEEKSLNWR